MTKKFQAFVGHSFTKDDQELVLTFTRFLNAFSASNSSFSWIHAEEAQPTDIVEKVLPMLRQSDIFIGICSKKERVVEPAKLAASWWSRNRYAVDFEDVEWKTSDWIIQEIAIAREREMTLILLLEKGVRNPGGLHGNLEYIPFSRDKLDDALIKVTEMIAAISRDSSQTAVSEAPIPKASDSTQIVEDNDRVSELSEPLPAWDRDEYERALFRGVFLQNHEYLKRLTTIYQETPIGKVVGAENRWNAKREFFQLVLNKGGKYEKLEALVEGQRDDPEMLRLMALANNHFGNRDKAAQFYEQAASAAAVLHDEEFQASLQKSALIIYCEQKKTEEARRVIREIRSLGNSADVERIKLQAANLVAELQQQPGLRIAALERQVAIDPSAIDDRFTLAHLYGEIEDKECSLYHYLAIPEAQRTNGTWNNIGVARSRLKMPIGAVTAFREAEAQGNTLAMSNLALELISSGFLPEARALCNAALAKPDYDPEIANTISRLNEVTPEEMKEEEAYVLKAEPRSRFMRDVGQALLSSVRSPLATAWRGPDCELDLNLNGEIVLIKGVYEAKLSGLLAALGYGNTKPDTYALTITGTLQGHAIAAKISRVKEGSTQPPSILGADEPKPALLVLSEDEKTIHVMEGQGPHAKMYDLKAL